MADASAWGGPLLKADAYSATGDGDTPRVQRYGPRLFIPEWKDRPLVETDENLVRKHLALVDRFSEEFLDRSADSDVDLEAAAIWLCDPSQDKLWGNKMLAGLCRVSRDDGQHLLRSYLAHLEERRSSGLAEVYWYTDAMVSRFRAGYVPKIAGKHDALYYGPAKALTQLSAHVAFFSELVRQALDLLPPDPHQDSDADTIANHAFAWAATAAVLADWDTSNPRGLIDAAIKQHENKDIGRLMTTAYRLGSGMEPELNREVKELVSRAQSHVDRDKKSLDSIVNGVLVKGGAAGGTSLIRVAVYQLMVALSAAGGAATSQGDLQQALLGAAAGAGAAAAIEVGGQLLHHFRASRPSDVAAVALRLEALSPETRHQVTGKLGEVIKRRA
ncbi:MAG: hypothetical protein KQH57_15445 [Actinomycetales bacterium]|nr:hypothetical protein [Actinomycetales bacterium]